MSRGLLKTKLLAKGSRPGSGGGGNAAPIEVDLLDFIDLINKTDNNGNNPSLAGLIFDRTYIVKNMDTYGYNSDCRYYVKTIKDENDYVVPDSVGTMVAPLANNPLIEYKTSEVTFNWKNNTGNPEFTRIGTNEFYDVPSTGSLDKWLLGGFPSFVKPPNITRTGFYGNWSYSATSGINQDLFTIDQVNLYGASSLTFSGQYQSRLLNTTLKDSSITFNCAQVGDDQTVENCTLDNASITFNSSSGANTLIYGCTIQNVNIIAPSGITLRNCKFIGKKRLNGLDPNYRLTITIISKVSNRYNTFIEGIYSDFTYEDTVDQFINVGGTTLDLNTVSPGDIYIGRYIIDEVDDNYLIDEIICDATHPFKIYAKNQLGFNLSFAFQTIAAGPPIITNSLYQTQVNSFANATLNYIQDSIEFTELFFNGTTRTFLCTNNSVLG